MRRVLYLESHTDIIGGGQISLLGLMRELDRSRYVAHFACPEEGRMSMAVRETGIPVWLARFYPLRLSSGGAALGAVWQLWRLVRRERISLIHANSSRCMIYAGLVGWMAGVPVIWHVRISESDGRLDKLLAWQATRIIAISRAVAAARFGFLSPGAKLRVIYNGVDLKLFSQPDGTKLRSRLGYGGNRLIGMVAQLTPVKRHADFIAAMALLAERFPDAVFLVVGRDLEPGEPCRRRLQALAENLGLNERVVFTGFREDVAETMAMLDVVVLTSENDAFGRVLVEAMAAARPVVATAGGGVPEVVEDRRTGMLVPVGDTKAIASAVGFLLDHPEQARRMGEEGRRRAGRLFSLEAHVRTVEDLYEETLGQEPDGSV